MSAGELRHKAVLEKPDDSQDGEGTTALAWSPLATVQVGVTPLSGKERLEAGAVSAEVSHRVRMRARAGVTSRMRLVLVNRGNRVLQIVSVLDEGERNRYLTLLCAETVGAKP